MADTLLRALSGLLVVSSLALLVVRPVLWSLVLLAAQSLVMAVTALVGGGGQGWLAAGVILLTKVIGIPLVLLWAARRTDTVSAVEWSAPWAWVAGVAIVLVVRLTLPTFTAGLNPVHATLLGSALLVALLGLAGMVGGRLVLSQVVHLVVLENGLYCAGLALTGGLPAALELGAAIDLLLLTFVLAWLSHHLHRLRLPPHVDQLRQLRG